jgi:hypothetical protein
LPIISTTAGRRCFAHSSPAQKNVDRRELHHERFDAVEGRDQPRRRTRPRRGIGWQQRLALTADMQDDRATFKQRNSVVAVARHLAERLFLEIVGRAFCGGIELAHGIGNAGFFERPARAGHGHGLARRAAPT